MSYRLVIAEKPSVGAAYAKVLGATNRQDGYWEGNGCLVSWCIGHLLLSAMQSASADSMEDDVERTGIGTPATRAATIEKMVQKGFLERKGDRKSKILLPTEKGRALVTVNHDELMLMMLYNTGTRQGLVRELRLMQCYLMPDETALRELSEQVIEKLKRLTDAEFAGLEFPMN